MRPALLVLLAALLASPSATAQERTWEVEVYGGGAVVSASGDGTRTLPPAGAPLVTSSPIFPSRETSSWFFGDGAVLLNDVNEEFDATSRITPLDAVFAATGGGHGGLFGVRVRRRLNARLSAEFAVDMLPNGASAPEDFAGAVEASRQSFIAAFSSLLATGPFNSLAIDATATSDSGSRRDSTATAALNVHWAGARGFSPYVTAGAGLRAGSGSLASAQLAGRYQFVVAGELPIAESDTVAVRVERPAALVVVLGGGVRRALSDRWGLSVDGRVLVGPDATRVVVDAQPSVTRGTPAGFIESFTNPAIQFSNEPSTGRRSTLSGPSLNAFEVFSGGTRTQVVLTVGLSRRF